MKDILSEEEKTGKAVAIIMLIIIFIVMFVATCTIIKIIII